MRVEKEKRKVNITCLDNSLIKGFVHINPGERIIDFINDQKENFIAVTESGKTIILNKSIIKYFEETES